MEPRVEPYGYVPSIRPSGVSRCAVFRVEDVAALLHVGADVSPAILVHSRGKRIADNKKPSEVQRTPGFFDRGAFHRVRIDHGGLDIAVPKQLLDRPYVVVGL